MSLNEASRKPQRADIPLALELAGVPRTGNLKKKVQEIQETIMRNSQNSFATDKVLANLTPEKAAVLNNLLDSFITGGQGREFDLSKPPVASYDPTRQYPKMVYLHSTGHVLTIHNEQQFELAKKKGFSDKPSPDHDYSKIKNGVAERKPPSEPRVISLEASDFEKELADAEEVERTAAATAEVAYALAEFPDSDETVSEDSTEEARPSRRRR